MKNAVSALPCRKACWRQMLGMGPCAFIMRTVEPQLRVWTSLIKTRTRTELGPSLA